VVLPEAAGERQAPLAVPRLELSARQRALVQAPRALPACLLEPRQAVLQALPLAAAGRLAQRAGRSAAWLPASPLARRVAGDCRDDHSRLYPRLAAPAAVLRPA
jgi:hypothetical protein